MTITVKLEGGLGNQMFQYAFGKAASIKFQEDLNLDLSFLMKRDLSDKYKSGISPFTYRDFNLDIFNINFNKKIFTEKFYYVNGVRISRLIKFDIPGVVTEKNYSTLIKNSYYSGLWQSRDFFVSIEEELRKEFTFKKDIKKNSEILLQKINNNDSVCINIRRTDFVGSWHEVCDVRYYEDAIKKINKAIKDHVYFIYSDDISWCRRNLKISPEHYFVDHDHAHTTDCKNFDNYLNLMRFSKHFIIPNSTFAWWAVWLSKSNGITISPAKWLSTERAGSSKLIEKNWQLI